MSPWLEEVVCKLHCLARELKETPIFSFRRLHIWVEMRALSRYLG